MKAGDEVPASCRFHIYVLFFLLCSEFFVSQLLTWGGYVWILCLVSRVLLTRNLEYLVSVPFSSPTSIFLIFFLGSAAPSGVPVRDLYHTYCLVQYSRPDHFHQ